MTNPLLPPTARSAGRAAVWMMGALLLLGLLCAAWIGVRGYLAYGQVGEAQQAARDLRSDLTDTAAASAGVADLAEHTRAAHSLTSDPVWRAAEHLPWLGDQLEATATSVAVVDDVASSALAPLVEVAQDFSVEDLRPADGRIDVEGLVGVQDVAALSADRVGRAADRIDAIDRSALLGPVARQVDNAGEQLRTASRGADAIDRASQLMPAMLGADGPRNYLLIVQNNAEWRSQGGLVGALAILRTNDGKLSLEEQASAVDFPRYDPPVLSLSEERSEVFDGQPARFMGNAAQVPDFPTTAEIVKTMWEREKNQTVDGVISVDPIALSYLLEATGPVTLASGAEVDSDNAVRLLLNTVYQRIADPAAQDEFFQDATSTIFGTLVDGSAEPGALIDALSRGTRERRILIWNDADAEQAVLADTPLQGLLPATDEDRTSFGVYLNDGTRSKMSYYQRLITGASWCADADGRTEAVLGVTLRSDAPEDAASLPPSIAGSGAVVPQGVTRTVAYLYLPEGSRVTVAESSGTDGSSGFEQGTDDGRPVLTWEASLAPGEEASATVRVSTPLTRKLDVVSTPTIPGSTEMKAPTCAAREAS